MIPNLYKTIASAIRNKRRIVIRYNGRSLSRVVEPHALFKSEDGDVSLLGYQVRGYHSSKRNGSFWRPFQLKKIDNIHVSQELFEARLSQGYAAVARTLKGEVLSALECEPDDYRFFDARLYGPPVPAYLAPTPTLMLRLAREASAQSGGR
ncbi:MAG: WYL domain-containing protein [Arenicellales bacterium]